MSNNIENNMSEDSRLSNYIAGRNSVLEALSGGRTVEKIVIAKGQREGTILKINAIAREKKIPVIGADIAWFGANFGDVAHQGVAALVSEKEYCEVEDIIDFAAEKGEKPFIIMCDEISDVHNLGAIIRTAECAGVHGIILPKRNSCPLTHAVFKTSAGAAEHMKIAKVQNLAATVKDLKDRGFWVFGTAADGESKYYETDYNCPVCLIVGSEGKGISRLLKENCDYLLSIPMKGKVASLNASVAAAVVIYEISKQRDSVKG